MSYPSKYPKFSKSARSLLTTGLIVLAATGASTIMPMIGMSTALLILPILSLAQAGWLAASTASTLMTGISWVGVSIIDYGTALSFIGAIALLPGLTSYLARFCDYLGLKNPLLGQDGLYGREYGLRAYIAESIQTALYTVQYLISPFVNIHVMSQDSYDLEGSKLDTRQLSIAWAGLFCDKDKPVLEYEQTTPTSEHFTLHSRTGLFIAKPTWYVKRYATDDTDHMTKGMGPDEAEEKKEKRNSCF